MQLNQGNTGGIDRFKSGVLDRHAISAAVILIHLGAQKAGQIALQVREVASELQIEYRQIAVL